jgi:hypothetical protein
VRAVVLLGLNILLFAGVGSFAFWLRTGVRFAPAHDGYFAYLAQAFSSVPIVEDSDTRVSLGSLLLEPISVQEVPMQVPIFGLLMAALIAVPILVSILYRFWSSLPFVAIVGFLAVMPWLAVTLLVSCLLASVPPFRTRFRFVSALLGLVPAVIYLTLAWYGTSEEVIGETDPVDRMKFIAPWVLAIVSAAVVFAVVLMIAKIADYRPGAIAPLLAVMLGLPLALFESYVGRDELYYRLLVSMFRGHFADTNAAIELEQAVRETWYRHPHPRPSMDAVRETVTTRWLFELNADIEPHRSALVRHQAEVADRADWFLKYFPQSRYSTAALFLKARALDMRVDPGEFRRTKWIRFYDEFPSNPSRETWRLVWENGRQSLLGAAALLRLAQFDARDCDVERALSKLDMLVARLGGHPIGSHSPDEAAGALHAALGRDAPESGLRIPVGHIRLHGHRLRDLLRANRDPLHGYDPLCGGRSYDSEFRFGLLDIDPRAEPYSRNLERLTRWYPHSQAADNVELELARASSSPEVTIAKLQACINRYPDRDAAPEAMFRLAIALREGRNMTLSDEIFERLARDFPDSIWAKEALSVVGVRTALGERVSAAQRKSPGE